MPLGVGGRFRERHKKGFAVITTALERQRQTTLARARAMMLTRRVTATYRTLNGGGRPP